MNYDKNNIFAKILRGEIPLKPEENIFENEFVVKKLGISTDGGKGYRALVNVGENGGQEVPHLHFHILGGEKVGKMVS